MNKETQSIWMQVKEAGLMDEKFFETGITEEEFNELLELDDAELLRLQLADNCDNDYIRNMTFDELLKLPFNEAKKAVDAFSMEKRIKMLDELNERRTFYYSQTGFYGDKIPKDQQLSPEAFRSLLGKIKHIEIIQNWLYGIA